MLRRDVIGLVWIRNLCLVRIYEKFPWYQITLRHASAADLLVSTLLYAYCT